MEVEVLMGFCRPIIDSCGVAVADRLAERGLGGGGGPGGV